MFHNAFTPTETNRNKLHNKMKIESLLFTLSLEIAFFTSFFGLYFICTL